MQERKFRKHWVRYSDVAALILLALIPTGIFMAIMAGEEALGWQAYLIWALLTITMLGLAIFKFFTLKSFELKISDQGISIKSGVLPWKQHYWHWDPDQIYRVEFIRDSPNVLSWALKYGSVKVVGNEGITHKNIYNGIAFAEEAMQLGNSVRSRV